MAFEVKRLETGAAKRPQTDVTKRRMRQACEQRKPRIRPFDSMRTEKRAERIMKREMPYFTIAPPAGVSGARLMAIAVVRAKKRWKPMRDLETCPASLISVRYFPARSESGGNIGRM